MNINQFLNFNKNCPICGNVLSLYLYASKSSLWKAEQISSEVYRFTHTLLKKTVSYSSDDYIVMNDHGTSYNIEFNTSKLMQDSKTWELFFFKLCNSEAVSDHDFDYDINWYESCYYRCSPWYQFKPDIKDPKKWVLEISNEEYKDLVNRDESFTFKKMMLNGQEKVYLLNLDSENQKTKFYYYTTTFEQRQDPDFEPKCFEKDDMPLMKTRLDLKIEHRDKLLSKLDTWILFS